MVLVGKRDNLGLDARTIARTDALNLSIVERRVGETSTQNLVDGFVGLNGETGKRLVGTPSFARGNCVGLTDSIKGAVLRMWRRTINLRSIHQ